MCSTFAFIFVLFFPLRAAVSDVFQPCRTCFKLLLMYFVVVFGSWRINDDDDDITNISRCFAIGYTPYCPHFLTYLSVIRKLQHNYEVEMFKGRQ